MSHPLPATVRAYVDALAAWDLAAARWLGLDPDQVVDLDVSDGKYGTTVVTWEAMAAQRVSFPYVEQTTFVVDGVTRHKGTVTLDDRNTEAFREVVGPMPRLDAEDTVSSGLKRARKLARDRLQLESAIHEFYMVEPGEFAGTPPEYIGRLAAWLQGEGWSK